MTKLHRKGMDIYIGDECVLRSTVSGTNHDGSFDRAEQLAQDIVGALKELEQVKAENAAAKSDIETLTESRNNYMRWYEDLAQTINNIKNLL